MATWYSGVAAPDRRDLKVGLGMTSLSDITLSTLNAPYDTHFNPQYLMEDISTRQVPARSSVSF
jgi:hypothetical protein